MGKTVRGSKVDVKLSVKVRTGATWCRDWASKEASSATDLESRVSAAGQAG